CVLVQLVDDFIAVESRQMMSFNSGEFPRVASFRDSDKNEATVPQVGHRHDCFKQPPAQYEPRLRLLEIKPRLFLATSECEHDALTQVAITRHFCCGKSHCDSYFQGAWISLRWLSSRYRGPIFSE